MRNLLLTALAFLFIACQADKGVKIEHLLCDYRENPIGVDTPNPQFNWVLQSAERGQKQTAYRLIVASSTDNLEKNSGDIWDSGKQSSDLAYSVYAGKALQSNRLYFVKLQIWDKNGRKVQKSAHFETAILHPEDWKAQWIGSGRKSEPRGKNGYLSSQSEKGAAEVTVDARSLLLRKDFEINKKVKRARVFVSGLGYYELFINGKRVGDKVLNPAKTNYRKEVLYDSYDVNALLKNGINAVGIHLGNGWFNPLKKWWSWRMQWFGSKRAILQMEITYDDGSSQTVVSDDSWKFSSGPIVSSCIYDGEVYDANLVPLGWNRAEFEDSQWQTANIVDAPGGRMLSQTMPAIKVNQTIKPLSVTNPREGVYVFDMGQNFAGWARLKVHGPRGTKIVLRYAENISRDGMIDRRTLNLVKAEDVYILKGQGEEIYEPHFTYHGFRYVEVSGFPGTPTKENVEGCVVHSAVEQVGAFGCSNADINRLHKVILWSQRSNLMGMPTDCPQRDERLGWMADAYVTAEEAMDNFDMFLFYRNWLRGIRSNQNAEGDLPIISPRPYSDPGQVDWGSGYILLSWYDYLHYGDKSILAEHFANMEKYLDYLTAKSDGYILPPSIYGDWVSVVQNWQGGDPQGTATAFFYYDAAIAAKIAGVLNFKDKETKFRALKNKISEAYNARYFNKDKAQYEDGTQFSNAFPLYLNMVPPQYREKVMKNLLDDILINQKGHLTTGILGTKYMVDLLTREDRSDIVYLLVTQRDYPGWIDLIKNRTTLSERWDQGGSNNHVMFGSIDDWFYRSLAGIRIDEQQPAFRHIVIKPFIAPDLSFVKASINTINGKVSSHWRLKNGNYSLAVSIPVNSKATVYVPAGNKDDVKESGKTIAENPNIKFEKIENNRAVFTVLSGEYNFSVNNVLALLSKNVYTALPDVEAEKNTVFMPGKVTVRLSCVTPNAQIRYTIDGSEPQQDSPVYQKELVFDKSVTLKAKAYAKGLLPSYTKMVKFSFVNPEKNGLICEVYKKALTHLSAFNWTNPVQKEQVYQMSLNEFAVPGYDFALRFSGYIKIEKDGKYTFYTNSNDGSRLYIAGKLVVDNDGEHGAVMKSGDITLKSGFYPIKLLYFQSGGSKKLEVFYEGPGLERAEIPATVLFVKRE